VRREEVAVTEAAIQMMPQPAPIVLSASEIRGQINVIQELMKSVMQDGVHFGTVPGCGDKPTLLQPGAQKLMLTFRLIPRREVEIIDLGGDHREVRVTSRLYSPDGEVKGEGVGTCSTRESRYRYRQGPVTFTGKPVPKGYWDLRKEDPAKAQALLGGRGFMAKKNEGSWEIAVAGEKVEHTDPADYWNTVHKIACKRADVMATITTLAASDIFTQDVEDSPELFAKEAPHVPERTAGTNGTGAPKAQPAPPPPPPPPAAVDPPRANGDGVVLVTPAQMKAIFFLTKKLGHDESWIRNTVGVEYGVEHLRDLSEDQASEMITTLQESVDQKGGK
jgi:hypothetical protein